MWDLSNASLYEVTEQNLLKDICLYNDRILHRKVECNHMVTTIDILYPHMKIFTFWNSVKS